MNATPPLPVRVFPTMDKFKELFTNLYAGNLARGLDHSTATAQALVDADREMRGMVVSTATTVVGGVAPGPSAPGVTEKEMPHPSAEKEAARSAPGKMAPPPPPPPRLPPRELTLEYTKELLAECNSSGTFVPIPLIRAVGSFFSDLDAVARSFEPAASPSMPKNALAIQFRLRDEEEADARSRDAEAKTAQEERKESLQSAHQKIDASADTAEALLIIAPHSAMGHEPEAMAGGGVAAFGANLPPPSSAPTPMTFVKDSQVFEDHPPRPEISLDIESVQQVYQLLLGCGSEGVANSLLHAMDSLAFQMQSGAHSHAIVRSIRPYLIVLEHPELPDPKYSPFLATLLQALEKVPARGKALMVEWIQRFAGLERFRR